MRFCSFQRLDFHGARYAKKFREFAIAGTPQPPPLRFLNPEPEPCLSNAEHFTCKELQLTLVWKPKMGVYTIPAQGTLFACKSPHSIGLKARQAALLLQKRRFMQPVGRQTAASAALQQPAVAAVSTERGCFTA